MIGQEGNSPLPRERGQGPGP